GARVIAGETYTATGSFADPGADTWTASVDYGDGGGPGPLALTGKTFMLSHAYATAGTFTVTVRVTDQDGGQGSATAAVGVQAPVDAVQDVMGQVRGLPAAGHLSSQAITPFLATLGAAVRQIQRDNNTTAIEQLNAFLSQVAAAVQSGRLSTDDGRLLRAAVERIEAVLD